MLHELKSTQIANKKHTKTNTKKPFRICCNSLSQYDFILKNVVTTANDNAVKKKHWISSEAENNELTKLKNRSEVNPIITQTTKHNSNKNDRIIKSNNPNTYTDSIESSRYHNNSNNVLNVEDIEETISEGSKTPFRKWENDEHQIKEAAQSNESHDIDLSKGWMPTYENENSIYINEKSNKSDTINNIYQSNSTNNNCRKNNSNQRQSKLLKSNSNMRKDLLSKDFSEEIPSDKGIIEKAQQFTNEAKEKTISNHQNYSLNNSKHQSNYLWVSNSQSHSFVHSKSQAFSIKSVKKTKGKNKYSILSKKNDVINKSIRGKYIEEFLRSCSGEHCENRDVWYWEKSVAPQNYDWNIQTLENWIHHIKTNGFKNTHEKVRQKAKMTIELKSKVQGMNTQVYKANKIYHNINRSKSKWYLSTNTSKGNIWKMSKENREYHIEILETRQYNADILPKTEKIKEETQILKEQIYSENNDLNTKQGMIKKLNTAISECSKEKEWYLAQRSVLRKQIQNLRAKVNFEFNKSSTFMLSVDELCTEDNWYQKDNSVNDMSN